MKNINLLIVAITFIFTLGYHLKGQNFDKLKTIQKELDQDYEYYAKADPKNIGAKRLAGKIGILDQGITVLIQKKDATTFEDVVALTEDLIQEAQKYNSAKAQNTQKIAKNLLSELQSLGKNLGFLSQNNDNSKAKNDQKVLKNNNNQTVQNTKDSLNTTQLNETKPEETDNENADNQENNNTESPKKEIKIYEEPYHEPADLSLVYAAIALLFVMVLVMWFSLNNAIKKMAQEMRNRFKEHDREIEGLEKIIVNGSMQTAQLTNFKEEVEKRFDSLERSTTMLLMEADKRLSNAENEIKLLDKAKLDIVQFEAFKKELNFFVTKEHFEQSLHNLHEKITQTEKTFKTNAIINTVITTKLTHHYDEHKIQIIEALEELKRKTTYLTLKELIDTQLPLLHTSKTLDDCNITAISKIVQLAFVASYNENLVNPYEKLTQALRLEGIDIEDNLIGRAALSEFNAENIPINEYLTSPRFRTSDYPNFIATKYEIENNPLFHTALPNTVLFILYPTVFSSRQGTKQLIKKGEYVIKS
jgi:hypothetical protein